MLDDPYSIDLLISRCQLCLFMVKKVQRTIEKVDVSFTKLPFLIDWMDYKAAEKAKAHMQVPVKVIRIPYGGK